MQTICHQNWLWIARVGWIFAACFVCLCFPFDWNSSWSYKVGKIFESTIQIGWRKEKVQYTNEDTMHGWMNECIFEKTILTQFQSKQYHLVHELSIIFNSHRNAVTAFCGCFFVANTKMPWSQSTSSISKSGTRNGIHTNFNAQ